MTAPTSQLDRLRDLVARLTPDQIRELAALLDPEDVELLDQVVRDTFVVEADAFDLIGYTPHPGPQTELHRIPPFSEGGPWDVLYGGAMGGGKTYALLMDAVEKALRYRGTEWWFVRATYRELERDVVPFIEEAGFFASVGARWNAGQYTLRFANGSRVRLIHCRSKADAANIRGQCLGLYVDERSLLDPAAVDTLALRIRSGDPSAPVVGIRSGTNPGGVGHSRLKEEFIDPAPTGRVPLPILDQETGEPLLFPDSDAPLTRWFLPSTAADNPSLDSTYYLRFRMMSAQARRAYRDGDWSVFEGMRFGSWSPGVHIGRVSDWPLDVILGGQRVVGIDYGSSAPFAAVWISKVRSDLVVVFRELHQSGLTPTEQAQAIIDAETPGEREVTTPFLDPSTWARSPEQPTAPKGAGSAPAGSIASRYHEAGVAVRRAHNDRITGWSLIDELLAISDDGEPRLVILDSCPNLIRSLSGAPRSDRNPEDVAEGYDDDHALDAFRYAAMGLLGGPARHQPTVKGSARRVTQRTTRVGVSAR